MYWSFLKDLLPYETYVENIKSTNLRIHELVIFNQTAKIDTHEEKYFHSSWKIAELVLNNNHSLAHL